MDNLKNFDVSVGATEEFQDEEPGPVSTPFNIKEAVCPVCQSCYIMLIGFGKDNVIAKCLNPSCSRMIFFPIIVNEKIKLPEIKGVPTGIG